MAATHAGNVSPATATDASLDLPVAPAKNPAYYILQAGAPSTACYLFHDETDGVNGDYRTDSVPVEIDITTSGRPAYKVSVSGKQELGHDTLSSFLPLNESSPRSAENEASTKAHSLSKEVTTPISRRRSSILTRSLIQHLVKKAQQRIGSRLLSDMNMHVMQHDGKHPNGLDDMYLLRNKDLEGVVEDVAEEMRRRQTSVSNVRTSILNSSKPALPRLSKSGNGFLPSLSTTADPATTICLPRTSVATRSPLDSQIRTKTREQEAHATTTIVSRRSVAEIVWAPDDCSKSPPSAGHRDSLARKSSLKSADDPSRRAFRHQSRVAFTGFSLNHYAAEDDLDSLVADISRAHSEARSSLSEPKLTSFPKLGSRHCTKEWLIPPVDLDSESLLPTSDFYHRGVDAHSGAEARPSTPVADEPLKPRQCDYTLFDSNPFVETEASTTKSELGDTDCPLFREGKRIGSSIGASSHRRKSSQIPVRRDRSDSSEDGLIPILVDKIRKGGHKIFHSHHGSEMQSDNGAPTPHNSVGDPESQPTSGIRSRDSIARTHTPEPAGIDRVGIYEAMTGSRLLVRGRKRGDTCSEDNRPHLYDDSVCTATAE